MSDDLQIANVDIFNLAFNPRGQSGDALFGSLEIFALQNVLEPYGKVLTYRLPCQLLSQKREEGATDQGCGKSEEASI
jgi:hypothetical protein